MSSEKLSVRVMNAALDESPLRGGSIILRGVIHPDSLADLKVDDYQREVLPITSKSRLLKALNGNEPLPDIELGMRGQKYTTRGGDHFMHSPLYIIDGLQRTSTAIRFMQLNPGRVPHLGAVIHFDTDRVWERSRFDILNSTHTKVSPNLLLRNRREDSEVLAMLYDMSNSTTNFPLYQRVAWGQRMNRSELITALMLFSTVSHLHIHTTSGLLGGRLDSRIIGAEKLVGMVGMQNLKANTMAFFNMVEACWGIRSIQYRDTAVQLKSTLLFSLARVISDHTDFWRNERQLAISQDLISKLKIFKIFDPTIANLASSGGKAHTLLYGMIVDHINSGKRTRRLTRRAGVDHSNLEEEAQADAA